MGTPIRAVYENGHLRPLGPVDLAEGQEVEVLILTERDRAIAALGDLIVKVEYTDDSDIDEEALLREIDEAFRGQRPLSEDIIEERREGP